MARPRPNFDYGNARLRVRKASLLDHADYGRLLAHDVDRLLGALADGPYGADLHAVTDRFSGLRALHEAVSRHLARSLEEMRSFYTGSAQGLVDLLLGKWELLNLLTLVRGRATDAPAEEVLANVVWIGALGEAAAAEVASEPDAERAARLLVNRRLPTPALARVLARAWPTYVRTHDLAALEQTLVTEHARQRQEAVAAFGQAGEPLARELEREADMHKRVATLRTDNPGEADLVALHDRLENRSARAALALFASDDPLGIAIPIAFTAAKEAEARNLRMIGEGLACRVDKTQLGARLLMVAGAPR